MKVHEMIEQICQRNDCSPRELKRYSTKYTRDRLHRCKVQLIKGLIAMGITHPKHMASILNWSLGAVNRYRTEAQMTFCQTVGSVDGKIKDPRLKVLAQCLYDDMAWDITTQVSGYGKGEGAIDTVKRLIDFNGGKDSFIQKYK